MDSFFSVDDGFWSPHAPPVFLQDDADVEPLSSAGMNRSSSEWAFQQYLQEATSPDHVITTLPADDNHHQPPAPPPLNIPINQDEHREFLKSRLELACSAVVSTWAPKGKAPESNAAADVGSQVSNKANGRDSSKTHVKDFSETVGVQPVLSIPSNSVAQVRPTSTGSSRSDDDDGETKATQNMDPADSKLMKRRILNRESARRSRKRKQARMSEQETRISELTVENATNLKRLSDINQKYNESLVNDRVLKANVETLIAKVKMADEGVKRLTGSNSLFHATSEITTPGMQSFVRSPETSANAAAPIQDQRYYQPPSNNHLYNIIPPNTTAAIGVNMMGRSVPMQRLADSEHMQMHTREGASSSGTGDQYVFIERSWQ